MTRNETSVVKIMKSMFLPNALFHTGIIALKKITHHCEMKIYIKILFHLGSEPRCSTRYFTLLTTTFIVLPGIYFTLGKIVCVCYLCPFFWSREMTGTKPLHIRNNYLKQPWSLRKTNNFYLFFSRICLAKKNIFAWKQQCDKIITYN